ncbi:amidohydrolase family protein [Salinibacterium hongtaonis]|uniref:4-hydroxyphenyl-beta-ketoacyl-CoA hydrolase n=1 Tax=Homoserinimonas hongtaonis TaxID=2079791 RepID=A0A2U1SZM3_9MICO|nr:amidohydrolase family protein [Salinibacterium hongtaonis]PWB97084.1 4-hydroxyphenyl-beta-ketoacyl-CoA hydrolase [Salinibacterium hongtaonis]
MSERYEPKIDIASIVAIDTHVHIESEHGHHALPDELYDAAAKYFGNGGEFPGVDETAALFRERNMAAVVFTVDAAANLGHDGISNDAVIDGAIRHADVLIPFASVDPSRGEAGAAEARRLVLERGARGFKFHPTVQGFDPSDRTHWDFFAAIAELDVPAVFHTGQTGIGAGTPGGHGLRLGLSNPMLLDDLAAAFPQLQIVMAHPSVPWQDEAISVATHKSNVWIDLSGWSPKYFPAALVKQMGSRLQNQVLFASDYPMIHPDRWIADFNDLDIKETVRPKIMRENALRLLRLND